ncbi:20014_t:CDS:2, partial [Entrophospora sp. SA101]
LGVGPRYCPSIEHKVCLFTDKEKHQIFVEPASREWDTIYLQGLSTSLPTEIQEKVLKTLPGFEKAQVQKWGYAIEYDVLDSTQLKNTLETKLINNLFTAGQINGTTGYEEAAAQGIIAGINANQKVKGFPPLIVGREQAYIGVLIDDLVTKEINDPYRLLTSRAEYRLLLRHDNADTRLYPIAQQLGLLSKEQQKEFQQKQELQGIIIQKLQELKFTLAELVQKLAWEAQRECEINIKYEGYIKRQKQEVEKMKKSESKLLPLNIDYDKIPNLSLEEKEKLKKIRPRSLAQAGRIAGINPTGLQVLVQKLAWEAQRECEINIKYEGYIKRQKQEVEKMKKSESKLLPLNIDYDKIPNLSLEEKEKLKKIRPRSLAQAGRIAGINPTGLQVLDAFLTQEQALNQEITDKEQKIKEREAEFQKEVEAIQQQKARDLRITVQTTRQELEEVNQEQLRQSQAAYNQSLNQINSACQSNLSQISNSFNNVQVGEPVCRYGHDNNIQVYNKSGEFVSNYQSDFIGHIYCPTCGTNDYNCTLQKTYSKLRQATTNERQISRFVNEAIEEKLARKKAEAEKELEQAYQEIAQDQAR